MTSFHLSVCFNAPSALIPNEILRTRATAGRYVDLQEFGWGHQSRVPPSMVAEDAVGLEDADDVVVDEVALEAAAS